MPTAAKPTTDAPLVRPLDRSPSEAIAADIKVRIEALDEYVRLATEERAVLVNALSKLQPDVEIPTAPNGG